MDQQKTGSFFKELRKEKGLTQEQLAEKLNVTGRTISRWETGRNMPDLDVLIEMADYYKLDIRELIDGERKGEQMEEEVKDTALKVADYSNEEKNRLMKKLHFFSWIGVLSFIIVIVLEAMDLADSGLTQVVASFCSGISFAMLIIAVSYTGHYIGKFRAFKKKIVEGGWS